jgi:hypothetical protein
MMVKDIRHNDGEQQTIRISNKQPNNNGGYMKKVNTEQERLNNPVNPLIGGIGVQTITYPPIPFPWFLSPL